MDYPHSFVQSLIEENKMLNKTISRVREAISIEGYQDEYNDWVIEVSQILKALDGKQ